MEIMEVLESYPDRWFSVGELKDILDVSQGSLNKSLRALSRFEVVEVIVVNNSRGCGYRTHLFRLSGRYR
jgi:predicted transcriptional regulator